MSPQPPPIPTLSYGGPPPPASGRGSGLLSAIVAVVLAVPVGFCAIVLLHAINALPDLLLLAAIAVSIGGGAVFAVPSAVLAVFSLFAGPRGRPLAVVALAVDAFWLVLVAYYFVMIR